MKILLVHKFFYNRGGAEIFFLETGKVLEEHGHEVAYFSTIDKRNLPTKRRAEFIKPPAYESGNLLQRMFSLGHIIYSTKTKKQFREFLKSFNPDLVHAFSIYVHLSPSILDACKEANIPIVMSCNDYKHICPNYKLYYNGLICEDCRDAKFYRAGLNKCCQNSLLFSVASSIEAYVHNALNIYKKNIHTFLFASRFMAHKTEEFWGKDAFRWCLLRNPFDHTTVSPCKDYGDYFLYFGRFSEEKGVHILLDAMRLLPTMQLILVGDGPQRHELEALTQRYNLNNVQFAGPKWGKQLEGFLRRTRFVILPSIWHENYPYVILQSFAMGKPVIGSDRGGIPELVKNGQFGFIYPAKDSTALSYHIKKLWDNPNDAIAMGNAAKKYVDEEFNYDKYYEKLMGIYKKVLG